MRGNDPVFYSNVSDEEDGGTIMAATATFCSLLIQIFLSNKKFQSFLIVLVNL